MNVKRLLIAAAILLAPVLAFVLLSSGGGSDSAKPVFAADAQGRVRVIITYRSAPGDDDARAIEALGGTMRHRYHIIPAVAATVPQAALDRIEANPNVARVEPDYVVTLDLTPNDPDYSHLWGLNNTGQAGGTPDADIDAPEAWDVTTGSSSVVVAVVDTGAQVAVPGILPPPLIGCPGTSTTHPDLAANIWTNPGETAGTAGFDDDGNSYIDDVHGWNFFDNAAWLFCEPNEDDHGTHVAGTIGATGNNSAGVPGVNWQVQIMVLKFIGPAGGYTSDAILAIQYAKNKGAKAINASWGGGGFSLAL